MPLPSRFPSPKIAVPFLCLPFLCPFLVAEPLPDKPAGFIERFCLDCHDADTEKGEVNLDFLEIDWAKDDNLHLLERVLMALDSGDMPPEKKKQPMESEREAMIGWLDESLSTHSHKGGTVVRRLNRDEYRNTVLALFDIPFQLPDGFPADTEGHGFDNIGESLILSPVLLDSYAEAAAAIADGLFPPERPPVTSESFLVKPGEMVISYSSSSVRDGAMRIVAKSDPVSRSCTWPTKFEVKASGIYDIKLRLSTFKPVGKEPLVFEVRAKNTDTSDNERVPGLRLLKSIDLRNNKPENFSFKAELYRGETVLFYFANAPLDSDNNPADKAAFEALLKKKFTADQRLLAAWQQVEHTNGLRGGIGWERVKALMTKEDLDLTDAILESPETEKVLRKMIQNPVLYVETISYEHFEKGPAIDVHSAIIEGPLREIEDPTDKKRKEIVAEFLGERGERSEEDHYREIFTRFLTDVHRRPVDDATVGRYVKLASDHRAAGHSFEQGVHLAIRTALISPRFLYRSLKKGKLDDYDLASRLSYFLTSAPPDPTLLKLAAQGKLSVPAQLRKQALRLLKSSKGKAFVQSFTGQWLDTRILEDIMPDQRLQFGDRDVASARQEVEMFFSEMVEKNRPMTDFIDPDFTYTSTAIARKIYNQPKAVAKNSKSMQRISLPRGGRHGGILGQSAVLMATANGVDTQPVIRGVWVLENVLGDPPPPPPDAVPAITPDTTGATTPKELLAAHANVESCAGCHRKIDPLGFALENFDPVGRWRDHYPVHKLDKKGQAVTVNGPPVDATGQLPDGTEITGILDLKRWIVANIDQFSECLSEKLLTYATGRPPGYAERKEIAKIVSEVHANGNGFLDLVLALIESETFHTK